MRFFLIFLISMSVFAVPDELAQVARLVKQRKAQLKQFREKVSKGTLCPVRDYECFGKEVDAIIIGHAEDIIELRSILEPFYLRSIKEGFPPCEETCQQNMLASHMHLFLNTLQKYNTTAKKDSRVPTYPNISFTRIRVYMDLSAFHFMQEYGKHLEELMGKLKLEKVTLSSMKDKSFYEKGISDLKNGVMFFNSLLCHLSPGDIVYNEMTVASAISQKKSDIHLASWMKDFESVQKNCADTTSLTYHGTDEATRKYYDRISVWKIGAINCVTGDFSCLREYLRNLEIHYAADLQRTAEFMNRFVAKSKPSPCDETCSAQFLIRTIQSWISYLSHYERQKLASTMDWKEYPEARYLTITEDVTLYETLKEIFTPLITEYGKIDPAQVTDAGLKSEMKSVGKDLSDFSSARMLKDSVICTMDPWRASYDRYMVPYQDKELNKKFEISFLEFKERVCK